MIIPVILAGGVGSRLWPHSRALLPKQFIRFPGQDRSLFQNTLGRLHGLPDLGAPLVLCNEEHRFLVAEQLRELHIEGARIVLEPVGRNTAPAIAIAALLAMAEDPQAILLVLPADHVIQDVEVLHRAIASGVEQARGDRLVTFGIVPGVPETGYGYIRRGSSRPGGKAFEVDRFEEKPDLATAQGYLASGEYLWNSGMFLFKASAYLAGLGEHAPDILDCCRKVYGSLEEDRDFVRISRELFEVCRGESIDYALMEHTRRAVVVPLDSRWSDLGAWSAVWELAEKDAQGNFSSGDVLLEQARNCYVQAGSRLVAVAGMDDVIVVETSDAVLVANLARAQGIKQIVERLDAAGRGESRHHDLVYRPWGSYQSLVNAEGYQVKHIVVNPGQALSLQMHHHRAEHWTVLRGLARVTRDEEVHLLRRNESIFLPLGCRHRLENPGAEPVELIEVQVGDYLGEDDIVRFEDVYGRAGS